MTGEAAISLLYDRFYQLRSHDSSVGVVTRLRVGRLRIQGSIPARGNLFSIFSEAFRWVVESTKLPIKRVTEVLFPGEHRP
jgi:hypothetical protein